MKAYRHGEMLLLKIEALPEGLTKTKDKIFATGSHGNNHSISEGTLLENENEKYLEAKNTKLLHPEHSPKGADIEDGYYQLITQMEYTPEGLTPVID